MHWLVLSLGLDRSPWRMTELNANQKISWKSLNLSKHQSVLSGSDQVQNGLIFMDHLLPSNTLISCNKKDYIILKVCICFLFIKRFLLRISLFWNAMRNKTNPLSTWGVLLNAWFIIIKREREKKKKDFLFDVVDDDLFRKLVYFRMESKIGTFVVAIWICLLVLDLFF